MLGSYCIGLRILFPGLLKWSKWVGASEWVRIAWPLEWYPYGDVLDQSILLFSGYIQLAEKKEKQKKRKIIDAVGSKA